MSSAPRWSAFLITVTLTTASGKSAYAVGDSFSARQDDLQLTADWTWAGCRTGGYYPIRIALRNFGPEREFVVEFEPGEPTLPHVSVRRKVDQNATVTFSLLIPMVGRCSFGQLRVLHEGEPLESLSRHVSLAESDPDSTRPGILIIATGLVECGALETAVSSIFTPSGSGSRSTGSIPVEDHAVIEPALLPDNWLAYSGLDLVLISLEQLAALADSERGAIINWVRAGGTLFVYEIAESPRNSARFAQLAELDVSPERRSDWLDASQVTRQPVTVAELDQHGNWSSRRGEEHDFTWDDSAEVFAICGLGFGCVLGFRDNPFSGSVQDWAWALQGSEANLSWAHRHGVSGRTASAEFLDFLIPGVRSVPMLAFLVFITVFTFVIGPLNYYILAKRNRLNFLVISIPAIALVTSVTLLALSTVAHGFDVKSRVRSLTLLDQTSRTAVTAARLGLHSGFAPSDGLRFSPSTAVIPIWPQGSEFSNGHVDWTETQQLSSGWLSSRTRTQFLTVNVRSERGRLTVDPTAGLTLDVSNGLEWDLTAVLVENAGDYFYGTNLAAGAAQSLQPVTPEQMTAFLELLDRSTPRMPEDFDPNVDLDLNDFGGRSRPHGRTSDYGMSTNLMEIHISEYAAIVDSIGSDSEPSGNRRWIAVVAEPPGVEFGAETTVIDGWHLVVGHY